MMVQTDVAAELLWLVQRASCLRRVQGWTKMETDRSWQDWQKHADAAMERVNLTKHDITP